MSSCHYSGHLGDRGRTWDSNKWRKWVASRNGGKGASVFAGPVDRALR